MGKFTKSYLMQRWWIALIISIIPISIIIWFVTRETLPNTIRIAAGDSGGLYDEFASHLTTALENDPNGPNHVEILPTVGSVANAILQAGAMSMDGLTGLVPSFDEVILVVGRNDRDIDSMLDLNGRTIILGPTHSGMVQAAMMVVNHYDLKFAEQDEHARGSFELLEDHPEIDGATITTGLMNQDLQRILSTGDFKILNI